MSGYILKDIAGYEGRYAITDDGRVWSHISDKWLKMPLTDWGYPKVCLSNKGKQKVFLVHKLVADAFCWKPSTYLQVNHIDGDKTNNNVKNLEWVTPSQNAKHAWDTGLQFNNSGVRKAQEARRLFSTQAVIAIRQMAKVGWTLRTISKVYKCSLGSIDKIVSGKSYKEVSL